MPKFFKPKGFGGLQSCVDYDVDLSEVRLTAEEWYRNEAEKSELFNRIRILEKDLSDTKCHYQDYVETAQSVATENEALKRRISTLESANATLNDKAKRAESALSEARSNSNSNSRAVRELQDQLADQRKRARNAEDANANLRRIARQRANADRDLPNGKTRSGYIIQSSKEFSDTWSTRLQSPYTIDLPAETVRRDVEVAVKRLLLRELGLSEYESFTLTQDFRGGYWIVDITHKAALGTVDPDLINNKHSRRN